MFLPSPSPAFVLLRPAGERENAGMRCAADCTCSAFACLSWPHACSMFEHTLHAGRTQAHTISSLALGTATLPPRSLLFSSLGSAHLCGSASLRQWRRRLQLLHPPWCYSCCCCSSSLPLPALSSPPRASTLKVLSFLPYFIYFVTYSVSTVVPLVSISVPFASNRTGGF